MNIDYGHGLTNIDKDTGIRYGVIPFDPVLQVWADESEPITNLACPHCGNDLTQEIYDEATSCCKKEGDPEDLKLRTCPSCNTVLCDIDFMESEPIGFFIKDEEIHAVQNADDPDIFIIKSPYYTLCNLCSPCAPGAGYILNQNKEGYKAYCFGPEFFEEDDKEKPTIYRVSDDSIVK
jgi:hypothetical protein